MKCRAVNRLKTPGAKVSTWHQVSISTTVWWEGVQFRQCRSGTHAHRRDPGIQFPRKFRDELLAKGLVEKRRLPNSGRIIPFYGRDEVPEPRRPVSQIQELHQHDLLSKPKHFRSGAFASERRLTRLGGQKVRTSGHFRDDTRFGDESAIERVSQHDWKKPCQKIGINE